MFSSISITILNEEHGQVHLHHSFNQKITPFTIKENGNFVAQGYISLLNRYSTSEFSKPTFHFFNVFRYEGVLAHVTILYLNYSNLYIRFSFNQFSISLHDTHRMQNYSL